MIRPNARSTNVRDSVAGDANSMATLNPIANSDIRSEIGQVSLWIAAQRRDVKWCVIQQVFELHREIRTVLRPVGYRQARQIEVISRLRIVTGVAGFQEIEDRLLGGVPAQWILH